MPAWAATQAWDALERFEQDVAAYQPKYVTVLLGMNDGHYRPFDQETFQRYHDDMTQLVGRISASGATPILMTPTMYDARAGHLRSPDRQPPAPTLEFYNSVLAYYGMWLQEVAMEGGYGFVDMHHPLNALTLQRRKTEPAFTMIADAVHPGPDGQVVMACAVIGDMQLPAQVSRIRIDLSAEGAAQTEVRGGEISGVVETEDSLEFTWTAHSLPWVLPEDAQLGVELTRLGPRYSRETLRIMGLPAGQYELSIAGTVVGSYGAAELSRQVQLQSNPKTPQYQQAQEVARLNKQRNDGPVQRLRGEWGLFQQHSRAAASLKQQPELEKLQQQVADLAKRLEGYEQRIVKHQQDAKQIEDQIYRCNQPEPRKYTLKRVP